MILNDLTPQEIAELDLRIAGKLIKYLAFTLSRKVNQELLEPISKWIDDPDWITRFKVYEGEIPNWVEYKRKEREWTQQQKELFRQRMKMYWQEIHKRRNIKSEVAKLLNINKNIIRQQYDAKPLDDKDQQTGSVLDILKMFSPHEKLKRETHYEFIQAMKQSISNLLPWRLLLQTDIVSQIQKQDQQQAVKFSELKIYYPENKKKDTVSKLIYLLQMATDRKITLIQPADFEEIYIEIFDNSPGNAKFTSIDHTQKYIDIENDDTKDIVEKQEATIWDNNENVSSQETSSSIRLRPFVSNFNNLLDFSTKIKVKDQDGETYIFDWKTLSNKQRDKIITDIKNNNILCTIVG